VSAICHNNLKLCVSLDEALIERLAAVIAGASYEKGIQFKPLWQ
jgi:hypothetical protein